MSIAALDPTIPRVLNVLIMDSEGKRIAVKYYSPEWASVAAQANFEKLVWSKTMRTNARGEAEVTMFDDYVVVFKALGDLIFYVTGSVSENELVLYAALQALFESVSLLLRGQLDKKTALENLDLLLLCVDEVVDAGLILETDPQTVASRVAMRGADSDGGMGGGAGAGGAVGSAEQTLSQALGTAREMLVRSLAR